METTVTQRVKEFLSAINVTPNALEKIIGIKQQTLSKQLKDGGSGVQITTIVVLLEAYPELSAEWLLRGEGDMKKGEMVAPDTERVSELKANIEDLRGMVAFFKERIKQLEGEKETTTFPNSMPMAAETVTYNQK